MMLDFFSFIWQRGASSRENILLRYRENVLLREFYGGSYVKNIFFLGVPE